MSMKAAYWFVLGVSLLCTVTAAAEEPFNFPDSTAIGESSAPTEPAPPTVKETTAPTTESTPPSGPAPGALSSWITYTRPDCCGPIGGDGSVTYELYVESGPSLNLGSNTLSRALGMGWDLQGGGRSLFFNTAEDAAWVIDLGLSYQYNHGNHPNVKFVFNAPVVHAAAVHRTFVSAALGRDWYLSKPAANSGIGWRFGLDAGGRWGILNFQVYEEPSNLFVRAADTIETLFAGVHTDVEIPCGCCTFQGGFRAEYGYTFMDIIPGADLQDLNLLLTAGVRY